MAKRILWAIFCLVFTLTGYASQLTATLQSGDTFTPFYGSNALVDAYNAAVDGDIITLSPGSFNTTEIKKGISIIGSYAFSDDTSLSTVLNSSFTISADDVTIEGIRVNNTITIKAADNLTITRSYIHILSEAENGDKKYHDNTTLIDCMIGQSYGAMSLSKNTVLRNCSINYFSDSNLSANPALIENCNITTFANWIMAGTLKSDFKQPYAIYRNCFLGLYNVGTTVAPVLNLYSPSEFHNIVFYSNFYDPSTSDDAKAWTIQFNSCIKSNAIKGGTKYGISSVLSDSYLFRSFSTYTYNGITVGPSDHKSYPATPKISSSEIDTETDADGNIHVKISAEARD